MTTFAPDAELEFQLFSEHAEHDNRQRRGQLIAWMADHLRLGGVVFEHYAGMDNAVAWTARGTHRWLRGRPLPDGYRAYHETSPDNDPDRLAIKLVNRAQRFGLAISFARSAAAR